MVRRRCRYFDTSALGTLAAESLYAFLIALTLLTAHWMATRRDLTSALVLGLVIGLSALTRAEGVGLVVLLAWPLVLLARDVTWRHRLAMGGVATRPAPASACLPSLT